METKAFIRFLINAKKRTYAGNGKEVKPERKGFKELSYRDGDWEYRDSYSGFFLAPGQEYVRYKGEPVWVMAYNGGMKKKHHGKREFASKTYEFLKICLRKVTADMPYRGPDNFKQGDYEYFNKARGTAEDFKGSERILHKGKEVYRQEYIGGMIVYKLSKKEKRN